MTLMVFVSNKMARMTEIANSKRRASFPFMVHSGIGVGQKAELVAK